MKNLSTNMRAMVLVTFAFASYNIGDAFVKHMTDFYSFAEAALYPVIFYAFYVLILSKKLGGLSAVTKTKKLKLHIIRSTFGAGCFICVVYAFQNILLAEAYTLLLSAPFWIAIMSIFFFKEHIGWHRWLSIVIGFIGVLIILRPGVIPLEIASIAALAAAIFFSVFVIYTKKIGKDEPLINMVLYPIIFDALILIPIIIFMGNWNPPQFDHFIFFAASGIFYLIGTTCSSLGYSSGESSLLAPIQYTQIIWGTLIGIIIFNEIPDQWMGIGATIIILSGIYLIHREYLAHKKNRA